MGRMWTALKPGTSSKVAADGPFEAVLGKTRRTEFWRGKGKPEARSSPPGAPSLLGFLTTVPISSRLEKRARRSSRKLAVVFVGSSLERPRKPSPLLFKCTGEHTVSDRPQLRWT